MNWQDFQKGLLEYKLKATDGGEHCKLSMQTVSLLGILEATGLAAKEYLYTQIQHIPTTIVNKELIIGKLFYYLFHFYDTLPHIVTRVTFIDEELPEMTIVWQMQALALKLQTSLTTLNPQKRQDLRDLKTLELRIHQLAFIYGVDLDAVYKTTIDAFNPRPEPIVLPVQQMRKQNITLREFVILRAIYDKAHGLKPLRYEAGRKFAQYYDDVAAVHLGCKNAFCSNRKRLFKLGLLAIDYTTNEYYCTEKAIRLLNNQNFT